MKYLKKFDTHSDYQTYISGSSKILPNVSYCKTQNEVHYNPSFYVDLDLPSGTLWAKANLGASTGYKDNTTRTFNLSSYTYNTGSANYPDQTTYTKYNKTDGLTTLADSDDAAVQELGGGFHIPTVEQFTELKNNTDVSVEVIDGKNYYKFSSKVNPSKYIIIPPAGNCSESSSISGLGTSVYLWANSVKPKTSWDTDICTANRLEIYMSGNSPSVNVNSNYRYYGYQIRPCK